MNGQGVTIEEKLNIRNTLTKFVLDQSIGAAANTIVFLLAIKALKGGTLNECLITARDVSAIFQIHRSKVIHLSFDFGKLIPELLRQADTLSRCSGVLADHDGRVQIVATRQHPQLYCGADGKAGGNRKSGWGHLDGVSSLEISRMKLG